MLKNKKFIFIISTFICCLCISNMVSRYVFTKSASYSIDGTVDVKDRTFGVTDIILKVGYKDTSCVVQDADGNDISKDVIKDFFVENEDVTDKYNNHFVQLKRYYVSMSQDTSGGDEDGVITYKLAKTKKDSSYFVCPYFKDKDGSEIPYAYYGKYKGYVDSNYRLCSTSVDNPYPTNYVSNPIENFRTYARKNGDQYCTTDWCAVFTVQIMMLCYYKTTNTRIKYYQRIDINKIGLGDVADRLCLGIEDIVGNGVECVDGMQLKYENNKLTLLYENNISAYSSSITNNETDISYLLKLKKLNDTDYNCFIKHMNYVSGSPILSLFPKEYNQNDSFTESYSEYYCNRFYLYSFDNDTIKYADWGSYGTTYLYCGPFFMSMHEFSATKDEGNYYETSRLHAKILS